MISMYVYKVPSGRYSEDVYTVQFPFQIGHVILF